MSPRFFVTVPMLATVEIQITENGIKWLERYENDLRKDITLAAQRAVGVPYDTKSPMPYSRVVAKAIGQHGEVVIVEVPA